MSEFFRNGGVGMYPVLLLGSLAVAAAVLWAIRLEPRFAVAHHNLGLALSRKGRMDEAIVAFRRAIDLPFTVAADSVSQRFRVLSLDSADDLYITLRFRMTLNANGEVTVELEDSEVECR